MKTKPRASLTDLQLDQIEQRRDSLYRYDIWTDGDEIGDEVRADLDALIEEVKRLRKETSK